MNLLGWKLFFCTMWALEAPLATRSRVSFARAFSSTSRVPVRSKQGALNTPERAVLPRLTCMPSASRGRPCDTIVNARRSFRSSSLRPHQLDLLAKGKAKSRHESVLIGACKQAGASLSPSISQATILQMEYLSSFLRDRTSEEKEFLGSADF